MNKRICSIVLAGGLLATAVVAGPATAAKKKKKPKPPQPVACQPYAPGELGAQAETLVLTEANTADAPLTHAFSLGANVGEGFPEAVNEEAGTALPEAPHYYVNVQVDTAAAAGAGLYATWEFPQRRDYDMWARYPDGSEAASSHGFQPLLETKGQPGNADQSNTGGNHAGESTPTSENLVGVTTPDCAGYTLDLATYLGDGGDFELKLWLGEPQTDPRPVGELPL